MKTKRSTKKQFEAVKTLVNEDGSINVTTFYTKTGKWHVVGTISKQGECIDECYNKSTGERITRHRSELKRLEEQGYIFDVGK